jgi:hypothetical protein
MTGHTENRLGKGPLPTARLSRRDIACCAAGQASEAKGWNGRRDAELVSGVTIVSVVWFTSTCWR